MDFVLSGAEGDGPDLARGRLPGAANHRPAPGDSGGLGWHPPGLAGRRRQPLRNVPDLRLRVARWLAWRNPFCNQVALPQCREEGMACRSSAVEALYS